MLLTLKVSEFNPGAYKYMLLILAAKGMLLGYHYSANFCGKAFKLKNLPFDHDLVLQIVPSYNTGMPWSHVRQLLWSPGQHFLTVNE